MSPYATPTERLEELERRVLKLEHRVGALEACVPELDQASVRCELAHPPGKVRLVCPSTCPCTREDQRFMREAERAIARYLRASRAKPEGT